MRIVIPVVFLVFALIIGGAMMQMSDNERAINDAQAQIEAARAMQYTAEAARSAAAGQARATTALVVVSILLVVVLLVILAVIGVAWVRARLAPKRKWAPGPNAGWKQVGDGGPPAPARIEDTLLQLLLMQQLAARRQDPAPPAKRDDELPWGWGP
jgi:hypothetical protein